MTVGDIMKNERRFYVYEWFKVDTLEIFYVGKGTGCRRFELHNRNNYFNNIFNKYKCAVRIYKMNLTNDEAKEWEKERIAELRVIGQAKTNLTNGGDGWSTGDLNPAVKDPKYGDRNGMRTKNIDFSGEKNPFANRRHKEESLEKMSINRKGKGGQPNHKNSQAKCFEVIFPDGNIEYLIAKDCKIKFGKSAYYRAIKNDLIIHYIGAKETKDKEIYEGTILKPITKDEFIQKCSTTIETTLCKVEGSRVQPSGWKREASLMDEDIV